MNQNENMGVEITLTEENESSTAMYDLSPEDFAALTAIATELELQLGPTIEADTFVHCPDRAEHWFQLLVIKNAKYSFSADVCVGARLYDAYGNLLASDNDDGEKNSFLIDYELDEWTGYYLRVMPKLNHFMRFNTVISNTAIAVESISMSPNAVTLIPDETVTLSASVVPHNATWWRLTWSSSNDNVAQVGFDNGVVTAVSPGTATIYAEALNGSGKKAECTVTVGEKGPGLKTVTRCSVRKEMSMDDSAILRDSTEEDIFLQVDDRVSLLSTSTIEANGRFWYRILYNGMMTYVPADEGSFDEIDVVSPAEPNGTSVQVNTGDGSNLRLRCVPNDGDDSTIIGRFADGTTIMITNEAPQSDIWYAVYGQTTDGISSYGWCSGAYLGNDVEYGTLEDVDELTVRSGAGYNYTAIGKIYKGDCVQILAKECATANGYPWHKIRYNDSEGYVVAGNCPKNFTFETRWVALVGENNGVTLTPISSNSYLTQSEMENNAKIIFDYLTNKVKTPWSKTAICALLGNMEAESTINPGRWQGGVGPGYGLVQWDPASKWMDWARENNYEQDDLFGQLCKILNEVEMDGVGVWNDNVHQWQKFRVDPQMSFKDFTTSSKSAQELSTIFLKCYERPKDQSNSVIIKRQDLALKWLTYLEKC